jgi:Tfp pilus assembly protein FimT
MPDDPAKKKEELIKLFAGVESEAARLESMGRDVLQHARFARDVAVPLQTLYSQAPVDAMDVEQWDAHVQSWKSWHGTAKTILNVTAGSSFVAVSETATNTAISGVMCVYGPTTQSSSPAVEQARTDLFRVLERFPFVEEARASIRRLRLDSRAPGLASPLEHLEQALGSLEIPTAHDDAPLPILIPLRECIEASVTELIRRLPKQEKTGSWKKKVAALGHQCAKPGLDADHFDRLGDSTEKTVNELSVGKQHKIDRTRTMELFQHGLLALNALLDSIDEKLLRPS